MNVVELKKILDKNTNKFHPVKEDWDIEIIGVVAHPIEWTKMFLEWVDYFETYCFGAAALEKGVFKYESLSGRSRIELDLITGNFKYEGSPRTEAWWPIEGSLDRRVKSLASYAPPKEERFEEYDDGLPGGLVPRWAA